MRQKLDLVQILDKYAERYENVVIARVKAGDIPPPLRRATIQAKGSSKTLIDKGNLLGSITRKPYVQGSTLGVKVGIFNETVLRYAVVHEFGYPANDMTTSYDYLQIIPTRSFMRAPFDEHHEAIFKDMDEELVNALEKALQK